MRLFTPELGNGGFNELTRPRVTLHHLKNGVQRMKRRYGTWVAATYVKGTQVIQINQLNAPFEAVDLCENVVKMLNHKTETVAETHTHVKSKVQNEHKKRTV